MKTNPIVTICIPVYNGSKYLRETIQSALSQSFTDFEILIIDDQSTDDSVAIISEFKNIDSRIIFIQNNERLGLVGNWNECIKRSRGEWIKFIFQDDLLTPDCLGKMITYASNKKRKELVIFCIREFIFENNKSPDKFESNMRERKFFWDLYPNKTIITPKDTLKIVLKYGNKNIFGEPSSYLIHKKVFDHIGLFDPNFRHICDLEYWFRIGINYSVLMIPETLVFFRVHGQSTTSYNHKEQWLQTRYLDKTRLFRKFMFDTNYVKLREEFGTWPCNLFLKTKTSILARRARLEVDYKADVKWEAEFAEFCQENTGIKKLSYTNWIILAIRYFISKTCIQIKFRISP